MDLTVQFGEVRASASHCLKVEAPHGAAQLPPQRGSCHVARLIEDPDSVHWEVGGLRCIENSRDVGAFGADDT